MLDFRGYLFPKWFEPLSIPKFQICPEAMKGTIPWAMYTKSKFNHSETWTKISIPLLVKIDSKLLTPLFSSFSPFVLQAGLVHRCGWPTQIWRKVRRGSTLQNKMPVATRISTLLVEKSFGPLFVTVILGGFINPKFYLWKKPKKTSNKNPALGFNICLLVEGGLADSTRISVPRGDFESLGPASGDLSKRACFSFSDKNMNGDYKNIMSSCFFPNICCKSTLSRECFFLRLNNIPKSIIL